MSTLGNVFGKTSKEYGGGKNIWHEVKGQFPVGGRFYSTGLLCGSFYFARLDNGNFTFCLVELAH